MGVRFHMGQAATQLQRDATWADRRRHASATGAARNRRVEADWFVSAMPAERVRKLLLAQGPRARTPTLERIRELKTDWMVGIQFYLRRPVEITQGHVTFVDAPWALTALTQAQFWAERDFRRRLRRRRGGRLPLGRHLRLGHARDPLRQAGEALHEGRRSSARSGRR